MAVDEMEFADRVGGEMYRLLNQREDALFKDAPTDDKERIRLFASLIVTAEAMRPYIELGATPEKRAALADDLVKLLTKQWRFLLEPAAAQRKAATSAQAPGTK
jgi:hypothetical protein